MKLIFTTVGPGDYDREAYSLGPMAWGLGPAWSLWRGAYGLEPMAWSLWPGAYGLEPMACGLGPGPML